MDWRLDGQINRFRVLDYMNLYVPGQCFRKQNPDSLLMWDPRHGKPPYFGEGLLQTRALCRVLRPFPQVLSQDDHTAQAFHELHAPFTGRQW